MDHIPQMGGVCESVLAGCVFVCVCVIKCLAGCRTDSTTKNRSTAQKRKEKLLKQTDFPPGINVSANNHIITLHNTLMHQNDEMFTGFIKRHNKFEHVLNNVS